MYLKSIIIEGFKSYGVRTEVKGFDPEFNAITGLNGTGKSNILDSICFVLGITNLSHVRATLLEDLIYKNGRAGITKATVTLVFDNSDSSKSPLNYESNKEITIMRQTCIGGKNRYVINGSTVPNKAIHDFFSSVQLNVNNPHFLIMQGRITKVLNMKPPEILSMIEEAAGTRMYESKKLSAQKIIEKKDSTLKEMNEMVSDQLNPKIQRMKDERTQYIELQRIQREFDKLSRINIAWEYQLCLGHSEALDTALTDKNQDIVSIKQSIAESNERIKSVERIIIEAETKRDQECGGLLKDLEAKLKQSGIEEATLMAKMKSERDTTKSEEKRFSTLQKNLSDDEKALKNKKAELECVQSVFDELRDAQKNDAEALEAAQLKLQAVSSGLLANEDGENATLQDQLMAVKHQLTKAEGEIEKYQIQMKHSKSELETKVPQLKKTEATFEKDGKELQLKESELKSLQDNLAKMNYREGTLEELQERVRALNNEMRNCSDNVNQFGYRYPELQFHYQDPEPNFDRSKIRGLLCKLFTVKDERFARALGTAAGGKLYNVVVDNEDVASKLIERGQLRRRVTFSPMNKIRGNSMNNSIVRTAEQLVGKGNVFSAQSLVQYKPEYESVMSWAFGQVLICTTMDAAEKVFNHPQVRRKAVTLDGDVFDPSGVISGGAVDKSAPILLALKEFSKAEEALHQIKTDLETVNAQIRKISPEANRYENMKHMYELRDREVKLAQERVQSSPHYQLQREINSLKDSIKEAEQKITELKEEIKTKSLKAKELEGKMKNLKGIKEKELKNADAELKRIKKRAEESRENWKRRENEFETLNLEIKELEKIVQNGKEELKQIQEALSVQSQQLVKLNEQLQVAQEEVRKSREEVKVQKDIIGRNNKEIHQMNQEKEKLVKTVADLELKLLSDTHALTKIETNIDKAIKFVANMKLKHEWIEKDQEHFGQPGGIYDFTKYDREQLEKQIAQLKEAKDKIKKSVNSKAMDLLSNQEDKLQHVIEKKTRVEDDRTKILSVIDELDVKKETLIKDAWKKVNHDFNSILSSLLPSAEARLVPAEDDFKKGLKVRIGFGGIWKESLDELSGGQRSLVALSLILAMLLFKPAPLYILDEVDAALDPSHTQNIGQMLKAHFKQSQFIVVSLKEGMFNNANVLFRTSFVDGMSSVIRTMNAK